MTLSGWDALKKNNGMFCINFLHPEGSAHSFCYPQPRDLLDVPGNPLLQTVETTTVTGRTYTLNAEEMKLSSLVLEKCLKRLKRNI